MRVVLKVLVLMGLMTAWLSADAQSFRQRGKLTEVQDAFAASVRWGDFENAWQAVDPAYRQEHPMTDLEFERYQQVQISGYRDISRRSGPEGTVERQRSK